jgi:hypothetical protein
MDRPPPQPAQPPPNPAQQSQTTQRDMVFCHECENEWYRDEHGLSCPECGSDFTEIVSGAVTRTPHLWSPWMTVMANLLLQIEEDHDPRAAAMGDSDDDGMPPLGAFNHNRWANAPDPDEDDINQLHWRQNGPNSFSVEGLIYRNVPPQGRPNNPHGAEVHNPLVGSFATMLQSIVGGVGQQLAQDRANQPAGEQPRGPVPGQRDGAFSGSLPGGGRFTYHQTTRIHRPDSTHLDSEGDHLNG